MTAGIAANLTTDVVIVGAWFAGLGMAIALDKAGRRDYVIFEKAAEIGGTWRENTYPSCVCGIRSPLYSFSFEPKHASLGGQDKGAAAAGEVAASGVTAR